MAAALATALARCSVANADSRPPVDEYRPRAACGGKRATMWAVAWARIAFSMRAQAVDEHITGHHGICSGAAVRAVR